MAIYRNVQMSFWTDAKVVDDFTPEDRYFYLYLFTNPHTNLCGCYEISKSQMSIELGYTKEVIDRLLKRFVEIHNVISYDADTKEILLLNWHKYNWTKSGDFRKALDKEINNVKDYTFKQYLTDLFNENDTIHRPSYEGVGTTVTVTDTVSVPVTDTKKQTAEKILDLYHKHCPSLPKVLKLSDKRIKLVNARLKEYSEEQVIEVFDKAEKSDFLKNGSGTWKGADFEWILNTNNFIKIMEGNYKNKTENKSGYDLYRQTKSAGYDFEALEKETRNR